MEEYNQFLESIKKTYSIDTLEKYLDSINDISILIVGDTIIDEYQYGYTLGKSGKAPIVAFQNTNIERYDGGVLAIRNHLKDFCKVDILTGWKQIVKKRYIQENQKLFETYSFKEDLGYNEDKSISSYDIILIADFGHGFIDKELQHKLESEAKYIALNTQLNAGNMGMNTINKYTHRNYISIDNTELRIAVSNQFDPIEKIIKSKFTHETVSVTDSNRGVYIYRNGELIHTPALAKYVVDTIGAGDAYLSLTTPLAYMQVPLNIIGFFGNCAGAIACGYPGNKESVTKEKIHTFINEIYDENK